MPIPEPIGLPAWETEQDRELRPAWATTPMAVGEPRRRRTVRTPPSVLSLRRVLTDAEMADWWTWWCDETSHGVESFVALVATFGAGTETLTLHAVEPPRITPQAGAWTVELQAVTGGRVGDRLPVPAQWRATPLGWQATPGLGASPQAALDALIANMNSELPSGPYTTWALGAQIDATDWWLTRTSNIPPSAGGSGTPQVVAEESVARVELLPQPGATLWVRLGASPNDAAWAATARATWESHLVAHSAFQMGFAPSITGSTITYDVGGVRQVTVSYVPSPGAPVATFDLSSQLWQWNGSTWTVPA